MSLAEKIFPFYDNWFEKYHLLIKIKSWVFGFENSSRHNFELSWLKCLVSVIPYTLILTFWSSCLLINTCLKQYTCATYKMHLLLDIFHVDFSSGKIFFFPWKNVKIFVNYKTFFKLFLNWKKILNLPFNNDVLTAGEFTTISSKHMEWSHLYRCVQSEHDYLADRRELRTVKWCDLCLNSIVLAKLIKMLMRECLWEFFFWNPRGNNFLDISGLLVT